MRPRPSISTTAVLLLLVAAYLAGCSSDAAPIATATPSDRGAIVSATLVAEKSLADVLADFAEISLPVEPAHAVSVYKLVYRTVDARGQPTQASGAVLAPADLSEPLPLLSYQHGTVLVDADVPSAGGFEQIVGIGFAAGGYFAVLPDLLGLGESPGFHPYVHAASSATAVVDMIRAARSFAADNGIELSGQVFLAGYSEGGYATLAALRAIEAEYADEIEVTAAAPMAGPYDLSGVMAEAFAGDKTHPSPYYLPYLVLAYDEIYDLYDGPDAIFVPPYAELLPPLFDRRHTASTIDDLLPDVPSEILRPELVQRFETDPRDPLRLRLQENDVYDWTPRTPLRLYHCAGDKHVPPANTRLAYERFRERGAESVEIVDPFPFADHAFCAAPALLLAKAWFDSFLTE